MDWYLGFFRFFFLWGHFFGFLSEFDGLCCSRRWRDKLIKFCRIKSYYTKIMKNAIATHLCSKNMSYYLDVNSLELWGEFENSYNIQLNCCRIKNFGIDVKPWMNVLNIVYFQKKTIAIQWTDIQGFFNFFFWACKFSAYFQNLMGSAAVEDEEIERRHFARLKFIIIEQNIVLLHGILAALGKTGYSMHSSPFEASILELRPHCCGRRYCPR